MPDLPATDEIPEEPVALTDADMPDIDTLSEDSDFSGFMSSGVSDELRNLALRKLFHAPVFNIRDGLDEYDEDYTSFEKLGDIVTCDMKHQIEMQEQKRREAQELEEQARAEAELEDIERHGRRGCRSKLMMDRLMMWTVQTCRRSRSLTRTKQSGL